MESVCRCCGRAAWGVAVATAARSRDGHIDRRGQEVTRCGGCGCLGSHGTTQEKRQQIISPLDLSCLF